MVGMFGCRTTIVRSTSCFPGQMLPARFHLADRLPLLSVVVRERVWYMLAPQPANHSVYYEQCFLALLVVNTFA